MNGKHITTNHQLLLHNYKSASYLSSSAKECKWPWATEICMCQYCIIIIVVAIKKYIISEIFEDVPPDCF